MTHRTPYDAIAYRGAVVAATSSDHLTLCSAFHDGPVPRSRSFRMVELGCGDGANLLPLAYYCPDSTFIGIDNSSTHLAAARHAAEFLCLSNIHFVLSDVRDILPVEFAPADYVIAHGLYSWVPDDARDAILEFCRACLAPNGLAYISYNAQPGWATRRLVRESLLRARSVREAALQDKAARAAEAAERLLEDLPSRDYASALLLADELERVRHAKPGYVFHEYLADVNDGFWLGEFVDRASSHGLDYVTDAQSCRWEGQIPAPLKATLANRNLNAVEQEETADLLLHRYFRASILCRADAVRKPPSREHLLDRVHIATSLGAQSDPFDLTDRTIENFRGAGRVETSIEASVTKAAVVLLASQWPAGLRVDELYTKAADFLRAHDSQLAVDARSQLSHDVVALFQAGQVDLRLREPSHRFHIPELPCAHTLAHFEAEHRDALTTPYHLSLAFDPQALAFVRTLDGTCALSELQHRFEPLPVSQIVELLARWGLLESANAV